MSAHVARRTLGWEPVAELANDVVVSLYCPVDEPTWFVHRGDGPAPLRGLDEVRALRDALDAILNEAASSRMPDAAEIPFETVQRAARELHRQRGGHPAGWNGHCLTAAEAVLVAAAGTSRQPEGDS